LAEGTTSLCFVISRPVLDFARNDRDKCFVTQVYEDCRMLVVIATMK
jgi:hypothetical protein